MRISEDRYFRDLRPLLLAARMLKLEARTRTICTWTGMSRDRIRKLAGSTAPSSGQDPRVRHRGRSPRQTAYFFRSPRIYTHANVLACYFAMVDLVPHAPDVIPAKAFPSVPRGELLCEIYGALYSPCPDALIDFERAILLATALAERDEVALEHCGDCGGLMLIDRLALDPEAVRLCQACKVSDSAPTEALNPKDTGTLVPVQMSLLDDLDGTLCEPLNGSVVDTGRRNSASQRPRPPASVSASIESEESVKIPGTSKTSDDSR